MVSTLADSNKKFKENKLKLSTLRLIIDGIFNQTLLALPFKHLNAFGLAKLNFNNDKLTSTNLKVTLFNCRTMHQA